MVRVSVEYRVPYGAIMAVSARTGFLGLEEDWTQIPDVSIIQIPFEMTVSYGTGTSEGPSSALEASLQVEAFSEYLGEDLPAGMNVRTLDPWSFEGPTLVSHLESIQEHVQQGLTHGEFPILLGGEHSLLLPAIKACVSEGVLNSLNDLTLVQIDAHADLRDELNGERFSHGTVIKRCLDEGLGRVIQIGIRAFSKEESRMIDLDDRISAWRAREIRENNDSIPSILDCLSQITGPIWLSVDVDALDPSIVPGTGTPVPGGLDYWLVSRIVEGVFERGGGVIGADVSEIAPDEYGITQFTAASLASLVLACHAKKMQEV
ncbi:MAG: agmatinase [Euryarchaeota archaeon]|nr:agmatinase [Euryarchaeota archaeon]|tara:strand:+ start:1441 stop:2397 length:957 start_codon:yes stop_codon:yes gene_type:complete